MKDVMKNKCFLEFFFRQIGGTARSLEEAFLRIPGLCAATRHWTKRRGYSYINPIRSMGFSEQMSIAQMWVYACKVSETMQVQHCYAERDAAVL